jgi:Gpi18-like mannosyltransferase
VDAVSSTERRRVVERRKWIATWAAGVFAIHSLPFFQFAAGDVIMFVVPWYDHILTEGRIGAFAHPFSNYAPPYLYLLSATSLVDGLIPAYYLVKLLSWVGAIWLVIAAYRLLQALGARPILALPVLLLPSVVANVSMLGQADTFWVAPCILALAAAVNGRWLWVALWSGLAFSFKAQAAFFAPFVVHLFLTRRVPLHIWLVAPAVYVAAMIPAWLAGWPAWDLATVYLRQATWQPEKPPFYFISNGASWWTIYGWLFPQLALKTFWIGFVLALGAVAASLVLVPRLAARPTIALATVFAAGIPFLLPGMHERFYILADVLASIYALVYPSRRSIAAAVLMQFASAFPVYVWAFQIEPLQLLSPPCAAVSLFLILRELTHPARTLSCARAHRAVAHL